MYDAAWWWAVQRVSLTCGWKGNLDVGGERRVAVDCGEGKTAWEEVVIEVVG